VNYANLTDAELDNLVAQKMSARRAPASGPKDFASMSDAEIDSLVAEKLSGPKKQTGNAPVEAFTQSFGNAATFGYLPQIQAATEPVIQGVLDRFLPEDPKGFNVSEAPSSTYTQRRDQYIKEGQALSSENPYSSAAGTIAGAISSGVATGGGLSKILGTSGGAATIGGRLAQAAKTGAVIGAIRNPGDTEGEVSPLQPVERAKNAGVDALTGVAFQGLLEGVGKVAQGVKGAGKELKQWSQNKALKAVGAEKPAFKKALLNKKNIELGQTVLDEGIAGAGDDIADIAKNAESKLKDAQTKLNEVYKKADNSPTKLLKKEDINSFRNDYMNEAADRLSGTVDGDEIARKLNDVLDTMPSGKNPTFGELRKWRASIDNKINFAKANQDLPEFQAELLKLRSKAQEKISEVLGKSGGELKAEFARQNKRVSNLSEITDLATKKAASVEGNATFGMREGFGGMIGSAIGTAIGGPLGSIAGAGAGAVGANVARRFATPFLAQNANKIAMALESNPQLLGKFAEPLKRAASISPQRLSIELNMLLKKPDFKQAIELLPEFNGAPSLGDSQSTGREPSSTKFVRRNK